MMKILQKINEIHLPFQWLNLDYLPNSTGMRKEIYLKVGANFLDPLAILFYTLFGEIKDKLIISNAQWGNFCVDTWDPNTDEYNYELFGKSEETKAYLQMLTESNIEFEYSGMCVCKNWDSFLSVILPCIINHKAPYSPLFYHLEDEFVFYFHHTGSIGILYRIESDAIREILQRAERSDCRIDS